MAILGGTVCRMHGGASPQVQAKASERIKALAEGPALDRLEKLLDSEQDAIALAAARDLLDRAGYGAKRQIEVSVIRQEAERIAAEFGVPVETVYQYAGLSPLN